MCGERRPVAPVVSACRRRRSPQSVRTTRAASRPEDAEIVEFTRQLLRKHRIDEATAKKLQTRFGNDGFIQLTSAIGYYSMLAMTVNACELEAAPNAEVLKV